MTAGPRAGSESRKTETVHLVVGCWAWPRKMEIAVRKKKTFTIAQKANLKKDIQKYFLGKYSES